MSKGVGFDSMVVNTKEKGSLQNPIGQRRHSSNDAISKTNDRSKDKTPNPVIDSHKIGKKPITSQPSLD